VSRHLLVLDVENVLGALSSLDVDHAHERNRIVLVGRSAGIDPADVVIRKPTKRACRCRDLCLPDRSLRQSDKIRCIEPRPAVDGLPPLIRDGA